MISHELLPITLYNLLSTLYDFHLHVNLLNLAIASKLFYLFCVLFVYVFVLFVFVLFVFENDFI